MLGYSVSRGGPGSAATANQSSASPTDARLAAIRPDGSGDVTKTHVAWTGRDEDALALPDIASPLIDAGQNLVYLLDSAGLLTCIDAVDGSSGWSWTSRHGPSMVGHHATPVAYDEVRQLPPE